MTATLKTMATRKNGDVDDDRAATPGDDGDATTPPDEALSATLKMTATLRGTTMKTTGMLKIKTTTLMTIATPGDDRDAA